MPGRMFVTGGSGFVGSAVVEELVSRGNDVVALVRGGSQIDLSAGAVHPVHGDLFNDKALDEGMRDCDAVIHLVGIIMEQRSKGITFERVHFEGTKNVVDAATRNGVKRYVHMSALGTRPDARSDYHKTKFRAEEYVRGGALDWTIFRPSLIHGAKGEFMRMEAKWARGAAPPFLFMPYFGGGAFGQRGAGMLQPVFVKDVARAFVDALEQRRTIGEVFPVAGPDRLTWPQLHRTVAQAVVDRTRLVLPLPVWKAKLLTAVVPSFLLPFNRDQVIMSQENNTADLSKFVDAFGWTPRPFEATLRTYAGQL